MRKLIVVADIESHTMGDPNLIHEAMEAFLDQRQLGFKLTKLVTSVEGSLAHITRRTADDKLTEGSPEGPSQGD